MDEPKYSIDLRTNNGLWARLQSWFVGGQLITPGQGSQGGPVSASGHLGNSAVTDERILQISTVWRCVSLISTLTACLPLDVFETDRDDNRSKVGMDNPLARLLRYAPNQYMTAQEFRESMTMQLCFYGNAYALIDRNGRATRSACFRFSLPAWTLAWSVNHWFTAIRKTGATQISAILRFYTSKGLDLTAW